MEKAVFGKEGLELTPRELAKHLRGVNLITQRDLEAAAAAPDQYCHGTGLHPIAAEALKEKT